MISVRQKNNVSFGFLNGAIVNTLSSPVLTGGLEYLKQNPVAEVFFLDATTMIAPRTGIDYNQNPDYGTETFIREVAPVPLNPFGPGIIAALMMNARGYNGISAGVDTMKSLHHAWNNAGGKNFNPDKKQAEIVRKYAKEVLANTVGVSTNNKFTKLNEKSLDSLSKRLANLILENKDKKAVKKEFKEITEAYTMQTGFSDSLKVKIKEGHHFTTDIHTLTDDIVSVGKKLFIQKPANKLNSAVEDIVSFSKKKSLWAAGLTILGLVSIPPINNAITKLRTGHSGYVAYKDFGQNDSAITQEKQDKTGLWKAKSFGAAVIGSIVLTTMGAFNKKSGFFQKGGLKNFVNKIELKGKNAHMDLIRLIYGSSLISRVIFSRDEQEVKNTTLRDSCGFLNWLVLGGFVTKGVAHLASKNDRSFVNITGPIKDKTSKNSLISAFKTATNWLSNVSFKSLAEMKAIKATPKEKAIHTAAILAGLSWSMVTLGIGMPLLNNYMTNKSRENQLKQSLLKTSNVKTNSDEEENKTKTNKMLIKTISFSNTPIQTPQKEELFDRFISKNHKLI